MLHQKIHTLLFGLGLVVVSQVSHATFLLDEEKEAIKAQEQANAYYEHLEGALKGYLPPCSSEPSEECLSRKTISIKGSLNIDSISFIQHPVDREKIFVSKHYKHALGYEEELLRLEKVQNVSVVYNNLKDKFLAEQDNEVKTLSLAEIYGMARDDTHNVRAMYMKGVRGKTLCELTQNADCLSQNKLRSIFYQCGNQLGNTYLMLSLPEACKTLSDLYPEQAQSAGKWHFVHPDPNWGNYLYDEEKEQLYAIDLTGQNGISFRKKEDDASFSMHVGLYLLFYTRDMLREAQKACVAAKNSMDTDIIMATKNAQKALHIIYAHQSLFLGYKKSVDKVHAPLTIDFVFKSLFNWQKPYGKISPLYERCGYNHAMFESLLGEIQDVVSQVLGRKTNLKAGYGERKVLERRMALRD